MEDKPEVDDEIITCWCGAKGTHDELFDSEVYGRDCGGLGTINCECGGDLCVCHHHGEYECPGCEFCEGDHEGFEDYYDDDWDEDDDP